MLDSRLITAAMADNKRHAGGYQPSGAYPYGFFGSSSFIVFATAS
jgi:hypothetical protein